jgi:hypothetical protein
VPPRVECSSGGKPSSHRDFSLPQVQATSAHGACKAAYHPHCLLQAARPRRLRCPSSPGRAVIPVSYVPFTLCPELGRPALPGMRPATRSAWPPGSPDLPGDQRERELPRGGEVYAGLTALRQGPSWARQAVVRTSFHEGDNGLARITRDPFPPYDVSVGILGAPVLLESCPPSDGDPFGASRFEPAHGRMCAFPVTHTRESTSGRRGSPAASWLGEGASNEPRVAVD